MITDQQIAEVCQSIYNPATQWKFYFSKGDVHFGVAAVEEYDVVAFRGSESVIDWLRDFAGLPVRAKSGTHLHNLGYLEDGFSQGMELVLAELLPTLYPGRPLIVTGHSLGAARASIMAGLLAVTGHTPVARVVFGEPRPGFRELGEILHQSGMALRSYRNRSDPVTEVPDLLGLYVHPSDLIQLDAAGSEDDSWGLLRDHHCDLYVKGLAKIGA